MQLVVGAVVVSHRLWQESRMAVAARKFVVNKCHPATFQWPGCKESKKKPPPLRSFYWRTKVSLSVFSKCCVSTRFLLSQPPQWGRLLSTIGCSGSPIFDITRPENMKKPDRQLPRFLRFPIWPGVLFNKDFYVARPSKQDISPQCPASDLQAIGSSFTTFHLKKKKSARLECSSFGFCPKSLEQDIFVSWLSAFILVRMNSQR